MMKIRTPVIALLLTLSLSSTASTTNKVLEDQRSNKPPSGNVTQSKESQPVSEPAKTATEGAAAPGKATATVKLTPKIRTSDLTKESPAYSIADIGPLLTYTKAISRQDLSIYPKVTAIESEHVGATSGNYIYAKGLTNNSKKDFWVMRITRPYVDPKTKKIIAYEAHYLGSAHLLKFAENSRLQLSNVRQEIFIEDRLLPPDERPLPSLYPLSSPSSPVTGQIIESLVHASMLGKHDTVVINQGSNAGLRPGNQLSIISRRASHFQEHLAPSSKEKKNFSFPSLNIGRVVLFRCFADISYGLITESKESIYLNDYVSS